MSVNLIPTDETGKRNLSHECDDGLIEEIEDPNQLLNKRLDFLVVIDNINIEENPSYDCYVEYSVQQEGKKKL